jgi:hypothetical protein
MTDPLDLETSIKKLGSQYQKKDTSENTLSANLQSMPPRGSDKPQPKKNKKTLKNPENHIQNPTNPKEKFLAPLPSKLDI